MARDRLAPPPPGMERKRNRLFNLGPQRTADFAMVQPQRDATITSAALRQVSDENRDIRRRRRNIAQADRTWQAEAYDYAKKIGELGYLLTLQSNVVALCDFPVRRWDEKRATWRPNEPEEEGYDSAPEDVMDAFIGPSGSKEELIRRAARHIFTGGEGHLLGTSQDTGNGILWEFLSVLELFPNAEGVMVRKRVGSSEQEILADDYYTARLWRSDAAFSDLAESEVQRVLPICQEIVYLTQMVDATVKSRIPANMLFLPDELSFAGYEADADDAIPAVGDDGEEADPLADEIFDHFTMPISDPGSAARLVPLILRGKAEFGDAIKVIELSRALDNGAQELRQEALGRLASGLDTPPEIMSGRANVNHWTSAIIDQDFIVKHIIPVGRLIADFLTVAYLRPMLEAFEDMSEEEAMAWKIDFDASPVVARADEAKSARDLAEMLSDLAIVEANGFKKGDMVEEDEKKQRRLWELIMSAPQVFAKLLPEVDGFEDIDIEELLAAPPGGVADTTPFDKEEEPPESEERVPDTKDLVDAETGQETPDRPEDLSLLLERLTVASDAAVRRALEVTGARIVSKAQGEQFTTVRDRIASARKDRVVSMLTQSDLVAFNLTPEKLLKGAWDELARSARYWVTSWLEERGVDRLAADESGALVAAVLCNELNEYTATRMIDGLPPLSNGLRVPSGLVMSVLEANLLSKV